MELVTQIFTIIETALPAVLQIVGGFAIIATLTPNKTDDKILQVILDVVNFLGANLGKAKNDPK